MKKALIASVLVITCTAASAGIFMAESIRCWLTLCQ